MNLGDVFLRLLADDKGFEKSVVTAGQKAGDKAGQTLGDRMRSALSPKNLAIAGVAALGTGQVLSFLSDAVSAAREEEAGINQLNAALENHVKGWDGSTEAIERTIKAQQDQFAFSDGDQRKSLQRLVAITGGDVPKSMDLMRQAMDLARFRGIDLASAADIIGKVYGGNVGILSRYGIQVERGATSTEALAKIQELAAGQAEAFGESSEGAAIAAGLAFEDLQEDLGRKLLPVLTEIAKFLRDVVAPALTWFMDNALDPIGRGISNIADAFREAAGDVHFFAMNFGEQGDRVHDIADRYGLAFDEMKDRIRDRMLETGESFEAATDHIESEMEGARLATREASWEMMQGILSSVNEGGQQVEREFTRIAKQQGSIMRAEYDDIRQAAYQSQVEYAKGLLDAQNEPKVAMDALVQYQEETLSNSAQVAYLMGLLNSEELAAGLIDSRPLVNAQARATREAIINQLKNLGAYSWGFETGTSYAAGMNAAYGYVRTAAGNLAAATRGQIGINSEPEAYDSPLRGITKWGGNIVRTLADGILGELGVGRAAGMALAGALAPGFGGAMPLAGGAMGGVGGGVTYQLVVGGVERTFDSRSDFMNALDDLARHGEGGLDG